MPQDNSLDDKFNPANAPRTARIIESFFKEYVISPHRVNPHKAPDYKALTKKFFSGLADRIIADYISLGLLDEHKTRLRLNAEIPDNDPALVSRIEEKVDRTWAQMKGNDWESLIVTINKYGPMYEEIMSKASPRAAADWEGGKYHISQVDSSIYVNNMLVRFEKVMNPYLPKFFLNGRSKH